MPSENPQKEKQFDSHDWSGEETKERVKYDVARLGVACTLGLLRAGMKQATDKNSKGKFWENAIEATSTTIKGFNKFEEEEDPTRKELPEIFRSLTEFYKKER